jgi:hypothetical protein
MPVPNPSGGGGAVDKVTGVDGGATGCIADVIVTFAEGLTVVSPPLLVTSVDAYSYVPAGSAPTVDGNAGSNVTV